MGRGAKLKRLAGKKCVWCMKTSGLGKKAGKPRWGLMGGGTKIKRLAGKKVIGA